MYEKEEMKSLSFSSLQVPMSNISSESLRNSLDTCLVKFLKSFFFFFGLFLQQIQNEVRIHIAMF